MKANKQPTYSEAMSRLRQIVSQTSDENVDIDQLCTQLKEAQQLITFCKEKLTKTEEEIKSLLHSEEK